MNPEKKLRIGITGESGFLGTHLSGIVRVSETMERVPFSREFFHSPEKFADFASRCDCIIHLAAVSRSPDGDSLYRTNMELTERLADAVLSSERSPSVLFASTVQIAKQLPYHASKRDGAKLLKQRLEGRSCVVNMLLPNAFGPYGRPFYNSVISTFCFLAASGKVPETVADVSLELSFAEDLAVRILHSAAESVGSEVSRDEIIPCQYREKLPEIWERLAAWSRLPEEKVPVLQTRFEADLYRTFLFYRGISRHA